MQRTVLYTVYIITRNEQEVDFFIRWESMETSMDKLTKCYLYWCLVEFVDWRYSQSCWYFRPALWHIAPLTFSPVSSLPLPCVNKYKYTENKYTRIHYTVCNGGGGVWGHRRGGGLGQINPCRKVPLQDNLRVRGGGESQFGRLERKLYTPWISGSQGGLL